MSAGKGSSHAKRQKRTRQAAQRGDERRHRLVVQQKKQRALRISEDA